MCGKVCLAVQTCQGGACQCPNGGKLCSGVCVDTSTDPNNCGACGEGCYGGTSCQGGTCVCPSGLSLCKGSCTDLQTDPFNCSGCDVACAVGQTCDAGVCNCGTASVSFATAVQPIFNEGCATVNCHMGAAPAGELDLSPGVAYANLVNVIAGECSDGRKLVLPGDPRKSYIVNKLMGVDVCFGIQMPSTYDDIEVITDWICEGAPDN